MIGRRSAIAAASCALLLSGCLAAGGDKVGSAPLTGGRYVALGSSFAAGGGIEPTKGGSPQRCGRSLANYPTLLAERMRLTLYDATCSGAQTGHVLGGWDELPPQVDAVTADTRLVTVSVGGNDVNYVGNLFAASCEQRGSAMIDGRALPCEAAPPPAGSDYQRLEDNLRAIAQHVKARAPQARVVFVQYVTLVPQTLCDATPISKAAAQQARAVAARLTQATGNAAQAEGATVLEADILSAGHTPCDAEPWATGFPEAYNPADGLPWHPNRAGHAAIAAALATLLKR